MCGVVTAMLFAFFGLWQEMPIHVFANVTQEDTTKPTLNASISNGKLYIETHDTESEVKTIYVNGYAFTELKDGKLEIRLQQFDAGYPSFSVSAVDVAGNYSETYEISNPYYVLEGEETEDGQDTTLLPEDAQRSKLGNATAVVTEHLYIDENGVVVTENSKINVKQVAEESETESKSESLEEDVSLETEEDTSEQSETSVSGREFYTIQTASEKVFYLMIDKNGEEETVYFLTEITDNDLLHVTSENSQTLPKNSVALESAIPSTDAESKMEETLSEEELTEVTEQSETDSKTETPVFFYIVIGVMGVAVVGVAYYWKVVRKRKEDFVEDEDEDIEEYETEESEDEKLEAE